MKTCFHKKCGVFEACKKVKDFFDTLKYPRTRVLGYQQYQSLYRRRKETIERVFADAKEKHAMRYTQYRGLAQVTNWVKLKFAAMNLKKLATRKWKECFIYPLFRAVFLFLERNPAVA